jgi:cytochrome c551/c552
VGETNRGWGSAGDANDGLQRLVWNNRLPFEMRTVKAMPDGFEIEFTKEVNRKTAEDLASYSVQSFIYKYHPVYGSPTVNTKKLKVLGVKVSADGKTARIIVDGLRKYYIHQVNINGVTDKENSYSLVHPTVYYTLNNIPAGKKLSMKEVSTKNSGVAKTATASKTSAAAGNKTADDPKANASTTAFKGAPPAIGALLVKYTCASCHNSEKKQVGPGFKEVAKRNYSVDKIVSLIYSPQKKNWPDYATEMAPMTQVPKADAQKIAQWIRSLK